MGLLGPERKAPTFGVERRRWVPWATGVVSEDRRKCGSQTNKVVFSYHVTLLGRAVRRPCLPPDAGQGTLLWLPDRRRGLCRSCRRGSLLAEPPHRRPTRRRRIGRAFRPNHELRAATTPRCPGDADRLPARHVGCERESPSLSRSHRVPRNCALRRRFLSVEAGPSADRRQIGSSPRADPVVARSARRSRCGTLRAPIPLWHAPRAPRADPVVARSARRSRCGTLRAPIRFRSRCPASDNSAGRPLPSEPTQLERPVTVPLAEPPGMSAEIRTFRECLPSPRPFPRRDRPSWRMTQVHPRGGDGRFGIVSVQHQPQAGQRRDARFLVATYASSPSRMRPSPNSSSRWGSGPAW